MKISSVWKSVGVALLLAVTAFASNKGSLQIGTAVNVNGKQLAPGQYSVQWEGSGPEVQVSILKGKNVVATAAAHMVELSNAAPGNSALITKGGDGSNALSQIRFGGKKCALSLDGPAT